MAAAASVPMADLEQTFCVEQLYELQKRHGRLAEPKFSYSQRNALKAKFRTEYRAGGAVRHALYSLVQDVTNVLNAYLTAPLDASSWLGYRLWGYQFRARDIRSGRSRFANFRPSAPRELTKPVYDPNRIERS
jgi:hypothetical protein